MSKEKLQIGDYVKHPGTNYIGRITEIDTEENQVKAVDEDGDTVEWDIDDVEYMEKAEAEQAYIIFPDVSDDYHGSVIVGNKILKVGCQEITFEKIAEIYNSIKNFL